MTRPEVGQVRAAKTYIDYTRAQAWGDNRFTCLNLPYLP